MGEGLLEAGQQAVGALELAVLLVGLFALALAAGRVLEELSLDREDQARAGDELSLQDGAVVEGLAVGEGLGEAALGERGGVVAEDQVAGAVEGENLSRLRRGLSTLN